MNALTPPPARQFPKWLDKFTPDSPIKKAAFCASYRDLLYADEVYLIATIILWGGCRMQDEIALERVFTRTLWLSHNIRWADHPHCKPGMKALVRMSLESEAA